LPPGVYRLLVIHDGAYVDQRRVEVGDRPLSLQFASAGTQVTLTAVPATPCVDLRVIWDVDGPGGHRRYPTTRPRSSPATGGTGLPVVLPPGEYTVRATTADGTSAGITVTVPLPEGTSPPVLQLR
jgi:hypothetical protein